MSDQLLNPFLDDKKRLLEMKKYMIQSHPTFMCPLGKTILDAKKSHIVEYTINGKRKVDIVSHAGFDSFPEEKKKLLSMAIITDWDKI